MITALVAVQPQRMRSRVVACLPIGEGRARHLLHCGHVVVCNGAFTVRYEIDCPQCMANVVDALDHVPESAS